MRTLFRSPLFLALLVLLPLPPARGDHPFADRIRAEEGRIYEIARRAGAPDLAQAQVDLLLVAARDHYRNQRMYFPWPEVAPPARAPGNESVPLPPWLEPHDLTMAALERVEGAVATARTEANNSARDDELEEMDDRLDVVRDLLAARLDADLSRLARQTDLTDVLFSNGIDTWAELEEKAGEAEERLAAVPADRRRAALEEARGLWRSMEQLFRIPAREEALLGARGLLREADDPEGTFGILLVRRTHRLGPPWRGPDDKGGSMDVRTTESVWLRYGDRTAIEEQLARVADERHRTMNGRWHWGFNEGAARCLVKEDYETTVTWIAGESRFFGWRTTPAAERAAKLLEKVRSRLQAVEDDWLGPLNGLVLPVPVPGEAAD